MKFKVRESIIRLIDIVGALIGLSVSAVLILIIGLFVRRDGGNVFFKQNRVGLNGKRFVMWKFGQWLLMQKLFDKI